MIGDGPSHEDHPDPDLDPGVDVDVVVVGAGFAGVYLARALTECGFSVRVVETAPDVGGTRYWNRYPGCRCDIESMQYSFQFSEELQQEWTWTERYASQPEILDYIRHVVDRFDLRRHMVFGTRVDGARFDDRARVWTVDLSSNGARGHEDREEVREPNVERLRSRFVVLGVGCLSATNVPRFEGHESFEGTIVHTGRWPPEGVDLAGKRVAVIGTGSSAIQSIPVIATQAEHLYVFQRTPNYVVPARNRPLSADEVADIKADYAGLRARAAQRPTAFLFPFNPGSIHDVSPEERLARFERQWEIGGLPFLGAFGDLLTDREANRLVTEYWQSKIREVVDDPEVAEALIPDGDIFGGKRLCAGTDYFETFNRDDVTLVDVGGHGIERFTPAGVVVGDGHRPETHGGTEYEVDVIVLATGFDAMTGSVVRIDVAGPDGTRLADHWSDGPHNYLGLAVSGFPNLFNVAGPGSPSVFATMVTGIEHQGDWIVDCLRWMADRGHTRIEATVDSERAWVAEVARVAEPTLRSKCDSWYTGSNIEGKPRVFMPYIGGFPAYVDICRDVAADDYRGFDFA